MPSSKVKFEVGQRWRDGRGVETKVKRIDEGQFYPIVCDNGECYTPDGDYHSELDTYAEYNLIALVALPNGRERDPADIQADPMGLLIVDAPPTNVGTRVATARAGLAEARVALAEAKVATFTEDSHEALTFHPLPTSEQIDAQIAGFDSQPAAPTEQVKLSNPKDAIGDTKVPLWLCSAIAKAHWALGQFAGLCKYGAWNWRVAGVRASVYLSAMGRHIDAYTNGERLDPTDGTHHLGNVMACCAILLEAEAIGKLTDDRPPRADIRAAYAEVQAGMAKLKVLYADKTPHHWTITDEVSA
jgi:hypothetical protein